MNKPRKTDRALQTPELINLLDCDRQELEQLFPETSYRGSQIFTWLFEKGITDIASMTNLPKEYREKLSEWAEISYPKVVGSQVSRRRHGKTRL